jgi:hypothetical protein
MYGFAHVFIKAEDVMGERLKAAHMRNKACLHARKGRGLSHGAQLQTAAWRACCMR